jgi:hypothetical protein
LWCCCPCIFLRSEGSVNMETCSISYWDTYLPQLKRLKSGHHFGATLQRGCMVLPAAIRTAPRSIPCVKERNLAPSSPAPDLRLQSCSPRTLLPSFPRSTIVRSSLMARRGCGGGRGAACSSATLPVATTPYSLLNLALSPLPCAEHRCHQHLRSPDHGRVSAAAAPQAIARC